MMRFATPPKMTKHSSPRIMDLGIKRDMDITNTEVAGIMITTKKRPELIKLLKKGEVLGTSNGTTDKGEPLRVVRVKCKDQYASFTLDDATPPGGCSVEINGLGPRIETYITETAPINEKKDPSPIKAIKLAMHELKENKLERERKLAGALHKQHAI